MGRHRKMLKPTPTHQRQRQRPRHRQRGTAWGRTEKAETHIHTPEAEA